MKREEDGFRMMTLGLMLLVLAIVLDGLFKSVEALKKLFG